MIERSRVTLACEHSLEFTVAPPMLGEWVYCVKCRDMRTVKDAPVEYRVRCVSCPFGKRLGAERLHAERVASRHHVKTQHLVRVYNGKQLIYTVGRAPAERDTPLPRLYVGTEPAKPPPF